MPIPAEDQGDARKRFTYRRFKKLKPDCWSADGWYEEGDITTLPKPPRGWRWLSCGERIKVGDLGCDPRSHPVLITRTDRYSWHVPPRHPVLRQTAPTGDTPNG